MEHVVYDLVDPVQRSRTRRTSGRAAFIVCEILILCSYVGCRVFLVLLAVKCTAEDGMMADEFIAMTACSPGPDRRTWGTMRHPKEVHV